VVLLDASIQEGRLQTSWLLSNVMRKHGFGRGVVLTLSPSNGLARSRAFEMRLACIPPFGLSHRGIKR